MLQDGHTYTALMIAVSERYQQIAKALVEAGADVNARTDDGNTALEIAEENNDRDIAEFLKASGAKEFDVQYDASIRPEPRTRIRS